MIASEGKFYWNYPFFSTAYLLTKNGSLFALYLNKETEENMALKWV